MIFCFVKQKSFSKESLFSCSHCSLKKDDVAGRHGPARCDNIIGSSRKNTNYLKEFSWWHSSDVRTKKELKQAFNLANCKHNKSTRSDCIFNEYIKSSASLLLPNYVRLFNVVFENCNVT